MEIETILKIENEVVTKQDNISLSYDIYKTEDEESLYFVTKNTNFVAFKIDKDLNIIEC